MTVRRHISIDYTNRFVFSVTVCVLVAVVVVLPCPITSGWRWTLSRHDCRRRRAVDSSLVVCVSAVVVNHVSLLESGG